MARSLFHGLHVTKGVFHPFPPVGHVLLGQGRPIFQWRRGQFRLAFLTIPAGLKVVVFDPLEGLSGHNVGVVGLGVDPGRGVQSLDHNRL